METKTSELIARGILIKNEKILLCHAKKGGHYFFPGGHIEFGEKSEDTLVRELMEETGEKITVGKFVGAFENNFGENLSHHEVNLVFLIESDSGDFTSMEGHIEYMFVTKEELKVINFLPVFVKDLVLKYWDDKQTFWASGI